jgi:hypothetical protein
MATKLDRLRARVGRDSQMVKPLRTLRDEAGCRPAARAFLALLLQGSRTIKGLANGY